MLELCRFYRGDPRLNAWQEGFLAGLARILTETHGKARISVKQWAKFREIQDLMEQDDQPLDHSDDPGCE
ncbi:MAG: hypothetical protein NVSMB6_17700 [Burkholderiaceae bacterium]